MQIKVGDKIRAFKRNPPFKGREASPFAGRKSEEVTEVHPGGKCPCQPAIIVTDFSQYSLDEWEIEVVPVEIPSFAKVE